jgi:hypothetical protein
MQYSVENETQANVIKCLDEDSVLVALKCGSAEGEA